jgi:spore coat polysaccharide biosynthesis protein SpsF
VKTVAIIQARMGSARLPGKVLLDLGGDTVLAHVFHRVERANLVGRVVVATTDDPRDDAIVVECQRLGGKYFRGSESDVLDRYYRCARREEAETVVRITSDCPLIDPDVIDATIRVFLEEHADYASNVVPRRFPRGLDTEIFTMAALEQAWRNATEPHQREHVTPYFYEHPQMFRISSFANDRDYSEHRWTLDTPEDLELLRAIYQAFEPQENFSWREALSLMARQPELHNLNSQVAQKSVHD